MHNVLPRLRSSVSVNNIFFIIVIYNLTIYNLQLNYFMITLRPFTM